MKNFQIAGHLGATPELKKKVDGERETAWTTLRVAANGGKKADWFWVAAFGKTAELCCEHLEKGSGVAIHGRLRVEQFEGKDQIKLIADTVQFFSKGQGQQEKE